MNEGEFSPNQNDNVWKVIQHLKENDNFPFTLHVKNIELNIDYPSSHHHCCWTRTMLQPIWKKIKINFIKNKTYNNDDNTTLKDLSLKYKTLKELSLSIHSLYKRQQEKKPLCGKVNRIRYIHFTPPVISIGKNITGNITITFSLRRSDISNQNSKKLFPTFIAIEPYDSISSFFTITMNETRRLYSPSKLALLLLQSISNDGKEAIYSPIDFELDFNTYISNSSSTVSKPFSLLWAFKIYAAFYNSNEEQTQLDEPFTHLYDWKPNITQVERFAVMSPEMDPKIAFSAEKRHRATIERHLKSAINSMDGFTKKKRGRTKTIINEEHKDEDKEKTLKNGTNIVPRAKLSHIATLQSSFDIPLVFCDIPGNASLASVMPRDIEWPLQLEIIHNIINNNNNTREKTWRSPLIPASSSLERLACELSQLGERIEVDNDDIKEEKINKE